MKISEWTIALISLLVISGCPSYAMDVLANNVSDIKSQEVKSTNAKEMTADMIVSKAEQATYYAGDDGRSMARMMIVNGQGKKQYRQFTILRKDIEDGGDQNMLVWFSRPSDIKGTVFRVTKHVNTDDDRWLYLPGLDLVKRISAGDKRTSFVGSHFFYEDISGRSINQDIHQLISSDDKFYIIESKPKYPEQVSFSSYRIYVDKESFLARKIEYFDVHGEKYRELESIQVEDIDGIATTMRSKVSDLRTGGFTLMEFRRVKYNLGIPDNVFTERSLRKPPVQWLKPVRGQ